MLWTLPGLVLYVAYARHAAARARHSLRTVGEVAEPPEQEGYRVLVAGGDGELTDSILRLGAAIARAHDCQLIVLEPRVVDEHRPNRLEQSIAESIWAGLDERVDRVLGPEQECVSLVRLAPRATSAILETAAEYKADLILMGTHPEPRDERVIEGVLTRTSRSLVAVAGEVATPSEKVVVTTSGGPHAPAALEVARAMTVDGAGKVVLATIVGPSRPHDKAEATLLKTWRAAGSPPDVERRIVVSERPMDGILELAAEHDTLLLGAPVDRLLGQTVATGLSIDIAYRSPRPTLLVKRRERARRFLLRRLWDTLSRPLPTLTVAERAQVFANMRRSARADVDYYAMITLAAAIASAGLMLDSGAVIIGAMLVAPLMNPILAMAHGIVQGNWYMIRRGSISTFKGIAVAVVVGTAAAAVLPEAPPTAQIMARAEPNLLDLVVAVAAGAAAAYGVSRSSVSAALPGVAISVALVPPLCVVGWGLGQSRFDVAGGASILFLTNLTAIVLVGALVFILLGFRPSRAERGARLRQSFMIASLAVLALGIPLGMSTVQSIQKARLEVQIERNLTRIKSDEWDISELSVTRRGGEYVVRAIVYHYGEPDSEGIEVFQRTLEREAGVPVSMRITVVRAELEESRSTRAERLDPAVEK
jgi:uncharacterized hydrophobic protein (TIGR00271 family)